jgi:DNA-3-methyladenine glycosylase I
MTDSPAFHIRPLDVKDRAWVAEFMDKRWHSTKIISRGQVYYGHLLDGFAAFAGAQDTAGTLTGLVTYRTEGVECQLMTLDSVQQGCGVGTALVEAVKQAAARAGCKRLWLITTNDNLPALRFYQKRGFHLVAVYPNALEDARRLKPQIPLVGNDGIPLRDELQLELSL